MNYQAFTNASLALMYQAVRGRAVDDAPPLSVWIRLPWIIWHRIL